jgi:hypothetical protein
MSMVSVELTRGVIRVCVQAELVQSQRWAQRGHPDFRVSAINGEWFRLTDSNGHQIRQDKADENEGEGKRYLSFPKPSAFDLESVITMTSGVTQTVFTLAPKTAEA